MFFAWFYDAKLIGSTFTEKKSIFSLQSQNKIFWKDKKINKSENKGILFFSN